MSELKVYKILGIEFDSQFYHKPEADKVIADKDAEIAQLQAMLEERNSQIAKLKAQMPKYKQFIEDEKFKKKLVDEYDGYVHEWKRHRYIVTPYLNTFIKGILRALWLARAERANDKARIFYFAYTCGVKLNIDGYSTKEKGHTRMCTARLWRITWLKVERKCRAMAEEYK